MIKELTLELELANVRPFRAKTACGEARGTMDDIKLLSKNIIH